MVPVISRLKLLFQRLKNINRQVVIKFRQSGFKQGVKSYLSAIHKLINSVWIRKNCLINGRSLLLYQFTKRVTKLTNNYRGISLLSTSYKMLSNILLSRLVPYREEIIGDHQCGCQRNRSTTDQIFCLPQIQGRNGCTMRQYISYS
jgi:hypothetical protein